MFRSGDFFEDFVSGLGPDEWVGVGIVLFQVLHDGVFQLGDALEGAAHKQAAGRAGVDPETDTAAANRARLGRTLTPAAANSQGRVSPFVCGYRANWRGGRYFSIADVQISSEKRGV